MNGFLITKIQHGCQDDFVNPEKNPGVKMADHFLAIDVGHGVFSADPGVLREFLQGARSAVAVQLVRPSHRHRRALTGDPCGARVSARQSTPNEHGAPNGGRF